MAIPTSGPWRPLLLLVRAATLLVSLTGTINLCKAEPQTDLSDELNRLAEPDRVPEPSWGYTSVLFLTDRVVDQSAVNLPRRGQSDAYDDYFTDRHSSLTYLGRACVAYPLSRTSAEQDYANNGDMEVPAKSFTVKFVEFYKYKLDLMSLAGDGTPKFVKSCGVTDSSSNPNTLLFFHGWRTSFSAGVTRAAQLKLDLGRKSVMIVSWPSDRPGSLSESYNSAADEETKSSYLVPLSVKLASNVAGNPPSIIAHSMGALLYFDGLGLMNNGVDTIKTLRLNATVLAAPDLDKDEFSLGIDNFNSINNEVAVYCGFDLALLTSGLKHFNSRVGFCGPGNIPPTSSEPIIQVEGAFKDYWRHSYFLSAPEMIRDMKIVLESGERKEMSRPEPKYNTRHLKLGD